MFVLKRVLAGVSLGGAGLLVALLLLAVVYVVSVVWWSIWISVGFHAAGDPHSWWWACNHWGLLAPVVLG